MSEQNVDAMTSSASPLVMAAAASTALLVASAVAPSLKRKFFSSSKTMDDLEDIDDEGGVITADDVVAIFDKLFTEMQSVLAQLSGQIQQLQMAGQQIPEKQLRVLLRQEFERALVARQAMAFEDRGIDEDCLKEATWEFMGSSDSDGNRVKRAVERFQRLWENVTGEKVVGRRPGDGKDGAMVDSGGSEPLSQDKLIEAAQVYFDGLTKAMGDIVMDFKSKGRTDFKDASTAQALHMEFASSANEAGEAALKKLGITMDQFQSSVQKYSQSPEVGRELSMLQMKQQQELMAMGVPPAQM